MKSNSFTLIEILVVVAIVGILSGFIFYTVQNNVSKANIAKSQVFSESIRNNLLLNLVSEWKLDGNTTGSWGNLGTATIQGDPEFKDAKECISGQCMFFDEVGDALEISGFSIGNSITVSFWAKSSKYESNMPFSFNATSYTYGPDLFFYTTHIAWNIGDGTSNSFCSGCYPDSGWHHFLLINDQASNAKLYIDSVLIGTANYKSVSTTSSTFYIARYDYNTSYNFNGYIDEFMMFDKAFSQSEISDFLSKQKSASRASLF